MSIQSTPEQLKEMMTGAVTAALQAAQIPPSTPTPPQPPHVSQAQRPERPGIDIGVNESQWAFFADEWKCYKRRAYVNENEVVDELRPSCTKELRKVLFDFLGSSTLQLVTEEQLLEKIKSAAVISKKMSVHRKEFYSIKQSPGEPINLFVAKLKAKAENCNFTIKCTSGACDHKSNSYSESMIADQMTAGILNKDIQEELLSTDKELTTFQARYDLIIAYELGKLAKSQLDVDESQANAMKSQYRKNQEFKRVQTKTKNDYNCLGCGSRLHRSNERESKCPAWGKTCFNCNGPNHFSGVCQKPKRKPGYPRNSNGDFRSRPSNFENSKSDFQPTSSANVNMSRD